MLTDAKRTLQTAAFVVATISMFCAIGVQGQDIQPLPEKIPAASTTSDAVAQESIDTIMSVPDPEGRWSLGARLLRELYWTKQNQRQRLLDMLENDVAHVKDEDRLVGSRENINLFAPDLALKIARRLKDAWHRESWLGELAWRVSGPPGYGKQLLQEINIPEARVSALVNLATSNQFDFAEVSSWLGEVMRLGGPGTWRSSGYIFGDALSRFVSERRDEVSRFVKSQLKPDESIYALGKMSFNVARLRNDQDTARWLLDEAAALVPKAVKRDKAVMDLFYCGYGRLRPEEAIRLFDEFMMPTISESNIDYPFSMLCGVDFRVALPRLQGAAQRLNLSYVDVLPKVIGRAVQGGPNEVLAWVQDIPPSPLRDAVVVSIAGGLCGYATNSRPQGVVVQKWIDALWALTTQIRDPKEKWSACEGLVALAWHGRLTVSQDIDNELTRLFPEVESVLKPWQREFAEIKHLHRLPLDEQRGRIRKRIAPTMTDGDVRSVATLVRASSLPDEERRSYYRELITQAHSMKEVRKQSSALSGISISIKQIDCRWALEVMWEAFGIARKGGLPTGFGWCSQFDSLGPVDPPASAQEALDSLTETERTADDRTAEALWSFAHTVNSTERDTVLAALCKVLLRQGEIDKTVGVARLIATPWKRASRLASAAAALHSRSQKVK